MTDNIVLSSDPAADLRSFLEIRKYSKITVLLDTNTAELCYPLFQNALPEHQVITVPPGEEHKTLSTCETIWHKMTEQQLDRHSALVIAGGGVLGDMGGFCAATYKRGIDFILVPTTLLSQVDASIGGKLGIDFQNYKNHIGVFQVPALTILYSGFLQTLPYPEIRSGFAEIIKHTLISDRSVWNLVRTRSLEEQPWDLLTRHSVELKSRIVRQDPKEKGLRKVLNTGHTIGHAAETHLLNTGRKVMHGEAVAAGIIMEAWLACKKEVLAPWALTEIREYVIRIFGKLPVVESDDDAIASLILQDKKNKGEKVLCVFLEDIGSARPDCEISVEDVKQALKYYRAIQT